MTEDPYVRYNIPYFDDENDEKKIKTLFVFLYNKVSLI